MSVAESGRNLLVAVIAAPFVAIIFWAVGKVLSAIFAAARLSGDSRFADSQESVREGAWLSLDLLELASSVETYVLLIVFVLAVASAVRIRTGW
jgi:hypothetical protein